MAAEPTGRTRATSVELPTAELEAANVTPPDWSTNAEIRLDLSFDSLTPTTGTISGLDSHDQETLGEISAFAK